MNIGQSLGNVFKKIDDFFLQGITDCVTLHSIRSTIHFQLFGGLFLLGLMAFDPTFHFDRFALYFSFLMLKLLALTIKKHLTIIIMFLHTLDWIISPYMAMRKADIFFKAVAFLLIIPSGVSLCYVSEKLCMVIAILNIAALLPALSGAQQMFRESSREFMLTNIDSYCEGILPLMTLVWTLGFLHRRRFENILKGYASALSELQSTNSKLTEANLKYRETVELLEQKNEELKQSKYNLEEAVKAKDQLLASVSHELRNPLNSLLGNIELLSFEIKDKKLKEMLDVAKFCGEILLNLINNLLDAVKFTSDKLEINLGSADLFEIIEKVWRANCIKIRHKNLKGELCISKNCPQFLILDSQRVIQIMLNLLSNSIKFTDQGNIKFIVHWDDSDINQNELLQPHFTFVNQSHNHINTSKKQQTEAYYTLNTQPDLYEDLQSADKFKRKILKSHTKCKSDILSENYHIFTQDNLDVVERLSQTRRNSPPQLCLRTQGNLKFEIIDTGCGISQEAKARLFQPFVQEDASVTRKYGGTGLGLFIIKKILSKMDGTIHMHSEKNAGSDFIVILPCKFASKRGSVELGSASLVNNPSASLVMEYAGVRALVVDDNPYNTKVMSSFLSKFQIESTICYDGREAYNTFVKKGLGYFSFVTMDIQMPEVDGISCAKMIRSYERHYNNSENVSPIPLIFVSGNSNEEERAECLDSNGMINGSFFFRKPLTFNDCQSFLQSIFTEVSSGPLQMLLVDDDPFNLRVLSQYMELEGIVCDTANDGREAVEKVVGNERKYDAIVMDCEMPGLDGISASRKIKRHLQSTRSRDILIVGVTGHSGDEKVKECMEGGMSRVFTKPVEFGSLISFLKKNIKR